MCSSEHITQYNRTATGITGTIAGPGITGEKVIPEFKVCIGRIVLMNNMRRLPIITCVILYGINLYLTPVYLANCP